MAEEIDNVAEREPMEETVVAVDTARVERAVYHHFGSAVALLRAFRPCNWSSSGAISAMVKANQEAAIQEAQKIQAQFKTLITKTSDLAEQGHAGAKMVMEGLQSQGLSVAPETKEAVAGNQGAIESEQPAPF